MATPPLVLIADDTPMNLEMVSTILGAEGFRTLEAPDGPSARAMARSERPDLVLLDVVMPGESGFETCAYLKSDPTTADIPIIFLSALDDVNSKVQGLKIGGVDYVSKPVHAEELLARVRVQLRAADTHNLLAQQQRERLEQLRYAQRAILAQPDSFPEAKFGVHYEPLEEAGGDFYDVAKLDDDIFSYFVADVSGHGTSAAFLTSAVKALLRQYSNPVFSPEDTMRGIDAVMRHLLGEEQYLTACYARLNRRCRHLSVVSAGHPPPLLLRSSGNTAIVRMSGDPLGVFNNVVLQRRDLNLCGGDRFFLYTDGLIEGPGIGTRKERIQNLLEACCRYREVPIRHAPEEIVRDLRRAGAPVTDDLLLLGVEAEL